MENKCVIYPKTKHLSPSELISQRNISLGPLRNGLKKTTPSGSAEESEELDKIYEELEKQLSVPRIDRLGGRSQGEWDPEQNAVKVLRKEGKFNVFGHSVNGEIYLEPYEALFLLELNRIDILYFSMTMSIEQGYLLFLGEQESLSYKKYLVYSLFSRIGYIVQNHQNVIFLEKPPTVKDCIWSLLENYIQNKPISSRVLNSEYFRNVENSMNDIRKKIISQEKLITYNDDDQTTTVFGGNIKSRKRKFDTTETEPETDNGHKIPRYEYKTNAEQKSFIDMLTKEDDFKKFQEMFQSFDIIKLKPQFEYDEEIADELEIHFDVYMHNENFKKSEAKQPTFRMCVLNNGQAFPNRSVISKCYHKQHHKVPVMVVSVSESKHIQAFLYYFT